MNEPTNTNTNIPINDQPEPESVAVPTSDVPEQLADLSNDAQQAEYRRAHLEQLRRMSCPVLVAVKILACRSRVRHITSRSSRRIAKGL